MPSKPLPSLAAEKLEAKGQPNFPWVIVTVLLGEEPCLELTTRTTAKALGGLLPLRLVALP